MSDELVRDGGFEHSPWWFTDTAKVDVSCQRTGQYAARVNAGGYSGTVSQRIFIPSNGRYRFSFWHTSDSGGNGHTVAVKAIIRIATPRQVFTVYENDKLGPNQTYKQESTPDDFVLESQFIEIVFSASANAPSPAWYVDDVSLVPVP
jgi:hypothetical protein